MSETLFPDLHDMNEPAAPPVPPRPIAGGPFASIAIERSLDRVLDYAVPAPLVTSLRVGQRVKVPLGRGNKPAGGYVLNISPNTSAPPAKIKHILAIDDQRVLLPRNLLELARWMGRYYCCAGHGHREHHPIRRHEESRPGLCDDGQPRQDIGRDPADSGADEDQEAPGNPRPAASARRRQIRRAFAPRARIRRIAADDSQARQARHHLHRASCPIIRKRPTRP